MKINPNTQWLLFGLLAAFFWGTHSVIVRYLTQQDIPGITIAVARLYIAAFVLFIFLRVKKQPVLTNIKDTKFLVTLFGVATNFVFFHIGLEYTSASNAILLENIAPVFVLIFLFLILKEKIRRIDIIASVVTIFGACFTVLPDIDLGGEKFRGDLLEIFAAITWAVFVVASSKALVNITTPIERIGFLFNIFILSAIILTPFVFFYSTAITLKDVLFIILLGVFPTAIAYLLWYEAVARVSTISAALIFNLSIVFTFINAYIFLGEEILPNMIIGAVFIIAGITLSKLGNTT